MMRAAIAVGEPGPLRQAAHNLKGTSSNLGIRQVAALSEALEKKARSGILENAEALLAQLEREFERARQALDAGQRGRG